MEYSVNRRSNCLIAVLAGAACVLVAAAQPPRQPAGIEPSHQAQRESFAAPVNLKVLPTHLTGAEVHDLMRQWSRELGVRCIACHIQESDAVVSGGSSSRFADDSKPMKQTARLMFAMTEQINNSYIAKADGMSVPVTCGTCHRGKVSPEPFVAIPDIPRFPVQAAPQEGWPATR